MPVTRVTDNRTQRFRLTKSHKFMTKVLLKRENDRLKGFVISGHSTQNCDDLDGKLLCAAVSSAAYMTANGITEIAGCECDIVVEDGYMSLSLLKDSHAAQTILRSFELHIRQLTEQYSNIKLNLEV